MFFAWVSDRYRQRAIVIAVQACITLVGLLVTGYARPAAWRYAGSEILFYFRPRQPLIIDIL